MESARVSRQSIRSPQISALGSVIVEAIETTGTNKAVNKTDKSIFLVEVIWVLLI